MAHPSPSKYCTSDGEIALPIASFFAGSGRLIIPGSSDLMFFELVVSCFGVWAQFAHASSRNSGLIRPITSGRGKSGLLLPSVFASSTILTCNVRLLPLERKEDWTLVNPRIFARAFLLTRQLLLYVVAVPFREGSAQRRRRRLARRRAEIPPESTAKAPPKPPPPPSKAIEFCTHAPPDGAS